MNHPDRPPLWRPSATLLALLLVISPLPLRAGDLNTEVNDMFNNLGAIGNYTAPGAFRGQTFNTYTGGNLMMRSPNKVYQLAAIQFPSAKAGCGGIDVFGGSFSHISATEFKNMLKNITAALPGIAFQLALEAVSPLLGGLTKWAKGLETWINNARINSCETAKAIVDGLVDAGLLPDDDDTRAPICSWRSSANLLYCNWLNYFVYQATPYDLNSVGIVVMDDFKEQHE